MRTRPPETRFRTFLFRGLERGCAKFYQKHPKPLISMKRFSAVIFLAALGLFIKPVLADDASARVLASKLIDMTNGKEHMRAGFDAVMNNVIDNMHQHGMPQAGVDEIRAAIDKWYTAEINFDEVRPKMVDVYIKDFSEDDLKAIVAFYQSPIGQKAIKNCPTYARIRRDGAQEYTKVEDPLAQCGAHAHPRQIP